jgi:hypothetical protein
VYVNKPTSKARVHRTDCPEYVHRKADETSNGFWKGPFRNFNDAWNFAIRTGKKNVDSCSKCHKYLDKTIDRSKRKWRYLARAARNQNAFTEPLKGNHV